MAKTKKRLSRSIRRAAVIHALELCQGDPAAAAAQTKESVAFVKRWQARYLECNNTSDKPRSGRPRVLSKQQKYTATVLLCEQQTVPAVRRLLVAEHSVPATVSNSTVYRAVQPTMIRSKPAMQPLITLRSMQRRVAWAKQHLQAETDWSGVAAGDSTYFTLNGQTPDGRYWHMKGQKPIRFRPNKSNQLHAYAIMSMHGKTQLHFVSGTTGLKTQYTRKTTKKGQSSKLTGVGSEEVQDLMGQKLVPETRQLFTAAGAGEPTFLLDNAPAHVSKSTKKFFADNNIKVLQNWPANSPDLNPIENVWGIIKPQVYRQQYTTLAELKAAVLRAWAALPQSTLRSLMQSMPRRLRMVLRRRGGYIGY